MNRFPSKQVAINQAWLVRVPTAKGLLHAPVTLAKLDRHVATGARVPRLHGRPGDDSRVPRYP